MTRDEALRILGLESNATLDDARKAYRDLVKVVHPDKDSSPGAKQRFILVQDAYEVITSQQWQGEPTRAEKARRERERKEREAGAKAERERQEREAREMKERIRREKERAERERQERKEKQQRYTDAYVFSFLESGMEKVTKLKQYAAAINDFDNVIEYLSDGYNSRYVHDVYYWRGMAKYFLIQYNGAAKLNQHLDVKLLQYKDVIQDFNMAIYLRPDYAGAYYWRGRAKYEESRSVGIVLRTFDDAVNAVQDFDEAIRLRPDCAGAYYWRGRAKCELSRNRNKYNERDCYDAYDAAVQDFDGAIRLRPDYVEAYYWRGKMKCFLDQYDAAVQDFDEAIRREPDYAGAYYWRGNAKFGLKHNDGACQDYEKANALVTENNIKLDLLGELL